MAKTLISQSNIETITVRAAAALTTSYVASDTLKIQGANQLQLLVSFTKGSSDGCKLRIEFSEDQLTWYQESVADLLATNDVEHAPLTRKMNDSANLIVSIPISASFLRVSSQAITSGTGTSLSVLATIANI
ncbi:hypothetical protein ACFL6S_14425 [Candidatus Poribacteria bacterium]